MDEKQAVFEKLTFIHSKKLISTALITFNNYTIVMTNNSYKIRILYEYGVLSLLLIFELIQQAALVNFMLFLNIFKILKILF